MASIEEATIRAFIDPRRRPRWLWMLSSPERRDLDCLNHCADLDGRFTTWLSPQIEAIGLLRSHGAPADCHLISAAEELDGRPMPLEVAVRTMEKAGWGTILVCIPGRLAYYYDELGVRRALLLRTDPANADRPVAARTV